MMAKNMCNGGANYEGPRPKKEVSTLCQLDDSYKIDDKFHYNDFIPEDEQTITFDGTNENEDPTPNMNKLELPYANYNRSDCSYILPNVYGRGIRGNSGCGGCGMGGSAAVLPPRPVPAARPLGSPSAIWGTSDTGNALPPGQ